MPKKKKNKDPSKEKFAYIPFDKFVALQSSKSQGEPSNELISPNNQAQEKILKCSKDELIEIQATMTESVKPLSSTLTESDFERLNSLKEATKEGDGKIAEGEDNKTAALSVENNATSASYLNGVFDIVVSAVTKLWTGLSISDLKTKSEIDDPMDDFEDNMLPESLYDGKPNIFEFSSIIIKDSFNTDHLEHSSLTGAVADGTTTE